MSLDSSCKLCKKGHDGLFISACFTGCSNDECSIVVCNNCMSNEKDVHELRKNGHELVSD